MLGAQLIFSLIFFNVITAILIEKTLEVRSLKPRQGCRADLRSQIYSSFLKFMQWSLASVVMPTMDFQ